MTLWDRIQRRKLFQWAIAYLAGAWLLIQVLELLGDLFAWPDVALRIVTLLLAVGFLLALVVAWYHGEKGAQRISGPELMMISGIFVIAAGVLMAVVGRPPARATAGTSADSAASVAATTAEAGSIAVLPFVDMSPDHSQEYFGDGLAEELINALARLPGLRVAARTSAFAFKGQNVDVRTIGDSLNVAAVLEGSIKREANRLRVTAQLINVRDGYHLWSETYERELASVFTIQDEISRAIVSALQLQLAGDAQQPLVRRSTADMQAYELYLQGRHAWGQRDRASLRGAIHLFERAVARDSGYALAYAGLAEAHMALANLGLDHPRELLPRARAAAQRALALDATLAGPHAVLGSVIGLYEFDWPRAEHEFQRAIELDPGYPMSHLYYSIYLMAVARADEALAESRRALELDPLSAAMHASFAFRLYQAGEYEGAIQQAHRALQLSATSPVALGALGRAYRQAGKYAESLQTFERLRELDEAVALAELGSVYALTGRQEDALHALDQLKQLAGRRYVARSLAATIYLALGRKGEALTALEQAHQEGAHAYFVWVDPFFEPLHADPRWQQVMRRMNLPPRN